MIRLENITHYYGDKKTLDNLSLSVKEGSFTCLLGNSGSGKSTILRTISGLETPREGAVYIRDQVVTDNRRLLIPPHKRNIGFIFQDLALWPHLSVYENIAFGLKMRKEKGYDDKVRQALSFFDLQVYEKKYPHQLSGGQQQLLALARCMVLQPQILLLDEPLSNLDIHLKLKMLDFLNQLKQQYRITFLYVTHDPREALSLADEIIVLGADGQVTFTGTKDELKGSNNPFIESFLKF